MDGILLIVNSCCESHAAVGSSPCLDVAVPNKTELLDVLFCLVGIACNCPSHSAVISDHALVKLALITADAEVDCSIVDGFVGLHSERCCCPRVAECLRH